MGLQSLQYCAFLVVVAAVYLHLPVRMQPAAAWPGGAAHTKPPFCALA